MAFTGIATAVGIAGGTLGVAAPYKQQQDLFRQQIVQNQHFFVADWAESSWRHSEALAQAERQHAEAYTVQMAEYMQTEKIHRRDFQQARLQHQREVDIMLRAETREAIRDELNQQNNRVNNIQLCTTVLLGVSFSMVVEGILPAETTPTMATLFSATLGASMLSLSVSLWFTFILVRRLNQYTAPLIQCMLEAGYKRLGQQSKRMAAFDPIQTNEQFKLWLSRHCVPLRRSAMVALSIGVLSLFGASAILLQARFIHAYEPSFTAATATFWGCAGLAALTILFLEAREVMMAKQKVGVYALDWKDQRDAQRHDENDDNGFSAHMRYAEKLDKLAADVLPDRHRDFEQNEHKWYREAADPDPLLAKVSRYSKYATDRQLMRSKTRAVIYDVLDDDVLDEEARMMLRDVITPAAAIHGMMLQNQQTHRESWDFQVLQEVRDLDDRQARTVVDPGIRREAATAASRHCSASAKAYLEQPAASVGLHSTMVAKTRNVVDVSPRGPVVDKDGRTVQLPELRSFLGRSLRTTLVHVLNSTSDTIRLRSKVNSSGWFLQDPIPANSPGGPYRLSVPVEIPAATEVVFGCKGRSFPPGGIDAEVLYSSRDGAWGFKLKWVNPMMPGADGRFCVATLIDISGGGIAKNPEDGGCPYCLAKDDDDQTENNEVYFEVSETEPSLDQTPDVSAGPQPNTPGFNIHRDSNGAHLANIFSVKAASDWTWQKLWLRVFFDQQYPDKVPTLLGSAEHAGTSDLVVASIRAYRSQTEKVPVWVIPASMVVDIQQDEASTGWQLQLQLPHRDNNKLEQVASSAMFVSEEQSLLHTAGGLLPSQPSAPTDPVIRLWINDASVTTTWVRVLKEGCQRQREIQWIGSLTEDQALELLAAQLAHMQLDMDRLLPLYDRLIDDGAKSDNIGGKRTTSRLTVPEFRKAMLLLLVRILVGALPGLVAVDRDKLAEGGAVLPPAKSFCRKDGVTPEHSENANVAVEPPVDEPQAESRADTDISDSDASLMQGELGADAIFSGIEFVECIGKWNRCAAIKQDSPVQIWHGIFTPAAAIAAGQRMLAAELIEPAESHTAKSRDLMRFSGTSDAVYKLVPLAKSCGLANMWRERVAKLRAAQMEFAFHQREVAAKTSV